MRRYPVYIFDFDGTVADTCSDVWNSIEYACNSKYLSLPSSIREDSVKLALSSAELYRLIAGREEEREEKEFAELIRYHYRNLNDFRETQLYPHMAQLLSGLGKTSSCHIASNKAQAALDRLLAIKRWNMYFTSVQGTVPDGDVPKENMIRNIMQHYKNVPPCDILYIGDSYTDVKAARQNGIPVVGVTYGDGDTDRLLSEKPDFVVNSGRELYTLLLEE